MIDASRSVRVVVVVDLSGVPPTREAWLWHGGAGWGARWCARETVADVDALLEGRDGVDCWLGVGHVE